MKKFVTHSIIALAIHANAPANVFSADKSGYHLFNPVPAEQMRELSTDRPDRTESPYSVDAGHFQFEIDLLNQTRNGEAVESLMAGINAKAGLTDSIDLQVIAESLVTSSLNGGPVSSGYGDTTIRVKFNLFGNDEGDYALGIMPYYSLPTRSSVLGASEPVVGAAIPFAYPLPGGISGGIMLEPSLLIAEEGTFTDRFTFASMATFGKDLFGDVGGYLEFYNEVSTQPWVATLDIGFTWGMNPNLQWDLGANIGLTESTDDINWFAGVSFRL